MPKPFIQKETVKPPLTSTKSSSLASRLAHDERIIVEAKSFTSTRKMGSRWFWTIPAATLEEAKETGKRQVDHENPMGYDVMVYAITDIHQVFVGTIKPGGEWIERRK